MNSKKSQNYAARVITKQSKYTHITPILKQLNWIPIAEFLKYRYVIIVYKCLHNTAPPYLKSLINTKESTRTLRSVQQHLLFQPRIDSQIGRRSFSFIAPQIWNKIPIEIQNSKTEENFKIKLKAFYLSNSINTLYKFCSCWIVLLSVTHCHKYCHICIYFIL